MSRTYCTVASPSIDKLNWSRIAPGKTPVRPALSNNVCSNRIGSTVSAALLSGAGKLSAMPCKLLVTMTSGMPCLKPITALYAALPLAFCARRAPMPKSLACRSASAVTVPCARNTASRGVAVAVPATPVGARNTPSKRTSPPSSRACAEGTLKPVSLNVAMPLRPASTGVALENWASLPGNVTVPCTVVLSIVLIGRLRRRA